MEWRIVEDLKEIPRYANMMQNTAPTMGTGIDAKMPPNFPVSDNDHTDSFSLECIIFSCGRYKFIFRLIQS